MPALADLQLLAESWPPPPEQATLHLEARSTTRASRLIEFLREWFAAPSWERPPA